MSTKIEQMKAGDFTHLAGMYSKYRPNYSGTILNAILGICNKPINELDFVDVGAGTGIWTRMVASKVCRSIIAVEPNDAMRQEGQASSQTYDIQWLKGSAENTGLKNDSADLLSMASSFHWADFDVATQEFHRILRKNGHFLAIWNPRYLDNSPLLLDIENYIYALNPAVKRISSGRSEHTENLAKKLAECPLFEDLVYLEGLHTISLTKEQYLGAWKSVNDIRVQLGENKFDNFLNYVADKISALSTIECSYQTRAYLLRKK